MLYNINFFQQVKNFNLLCLILQILNIQLELYFNGYLIPAFAATIIGLLGLALDLQVYLQVLFWQLECKDSVDAFIKKLKNSVYDNGIIDSKCEQLISISRALFSGQQEKLKPWARRWF